MENIDENALQSVNDMFNDDVDYNDVVEKICQLWENSAGKVLKTKSCVSTTGPDTGVKQNQKRKPWFNDDCKRNRINYLKNKDAFRRNKSCVNKTNLVRASKEYKRALATAKNKHRRDFEKRIRNLRFNDPKSYWKF